MTNNDTAGGVVYAVAGERRMVIDPSAAVGRIARRATTAGIVGALLQILGGILESVDRVRPTEPGFALRTSLIGIAYLLLLVALVGIARAGVAGQSWLPRVGLTVACVGWLLSAVAQFVLPTNADLAEKALFPAATVMIGLGMLLAGVAVLRAHGLPASGRVAPLVCGLYPFLVIFPTFAASGGPNFLVLSGWGVCWLALSVALRRHTADSTRVQ